MRQEELENRGIIEIMNITALLKSDKILLKSPAELRVHSVTQILVKYHYMILVWKHSRS